MLQWVPGLEDQQTAVHIWVWEMAESRVHTQSAVSSTESRECPRNREIEVDVEIKQEEETKEEVEHCKVDPTQDGVPVQIAVYGKAHLHVGTGHDKD